MFHIWLQGAWAQVALLCLIRVMCGARARFELDGARLLGSLSLENKSTDDAAGSRWGLLGRATEKSLAALACALPKPSSSRLLASKTKGKGKKASDIEVKNETNPEYVRQLTTALASGSVQQKSANDTLARLIIKNLVQAQGGGSEVHLARGLVALHVLATTGGGPCAAVQMVLADIAGQGTGTDRKTLVVILAVALVAQLLSSPASEGVGFGGKFPVLSAVDSDKAMPCQTLLDWKALVRFYGFDQSSSQREAAYPLSRVVMAHLRVL